MYKKTALHFVVLLGIVSLFADMTYEGARSITGQYLALLGATGVIVGFVAGFGELIGYGFRLTCGYLTDLTGKYWFFVFIGYACNLLAVPILALTDQWPQAAALIILERFGKALRSPAKDAMLSYATHSLGRGWGFGLYEAMDQIGAFLGPLIVSGVLYHQHSYQLSFAILLIPALAALSFLIAARLLYPTPRDLESADPHLTPAGFTRPFWIYIAAICCIAAGYIDFPLIAYHWGKTSSIPPAWIPAFFAVAMAAQGISALILGRLFDTKGTAVLRIAIAISSFFVPFVLMDDFYLSLAGMILWGVGLGGLESIMRALVPHLVEINKRGTTYGLLQMAFGISWFLGSWLIGYLYDVSLTGVVFFSFGMQWLSLPLLSRLKIRFGR